uniref:Chalcone synthase n=1 Tax=Pohlia nutans TaxID=140635 RepID=A0A482KG46_9BRYO|nr:chalcone synthase 021 [Pohlia nutans]QCF46620.1 chalcone synthase [Pohlia nutans]
MASILSKEAVAPQEMEPLIAARLVPRPEGPACVVAIGTAFPADVIQQSTYHDKLFAMCGVSDESLKAEFKYMCDSSYIDKRHTFVTPELVVQHPELASHGDASLTTRLAIANKVIPELAVEATRNAVREWGRPLSSITHMVLTTTSATSVPGIDVAIARALHLAPTVQRICVYQTGFSGGGAVLRIGRLLAESAQNARVLIIAVEANSVMTFRKPALEPESLKQPDGFSPALWVHSTLGDGAAALIMGCHPIPALRGVPGEHPLFEIHWSAQMVIPDSEAVLKADLSESGLIWHVQKGTLRDVIVKHLQEATCMGRDVAGASMSHSEMFWVVHPGAYLVLEAVEQVLGLERKQLQPSHDVLRNFGNCSSPTILFVLDEMRRRSEREDAQTTGVGCTWGLSVALGPGFNIEVSLLRSFPRL